MRKLFNLIYFIFLLSIGLTLFASNDLPYDLRGLWKGGAYEGSFIFEKEKGFITIKYVEVPKFFKDTYKSGDIIFRGKEVDGKIIGEMQFGNKQYQKYCPNKWKYWVPCKLKLSQDKTKVYGTFQFTRMGHTCQIKKGKWLKIHILEKEIRDDLNIINRGVS